MLSDAEKIDFVNNTADSLSDIETIDYNPDVEFLQHRPSHPRDILKRMQKQNEVKFFKKVPKHPLKIQKTYKTYLMNLKRKGLHKKIKILMR